jgi:hypothetical protein
MAQEDKVTREMVQLATTFTPEQEKRIIEIVLSAMYKLRIEQAKRTGIQAHGVKSE